MIHRYGKEEFTMAKHKGLGKRAPDRPELRALLERAGSVTLTEKGSGITRESAREAVDRIRIGQVSG